MGNSKEQIHRYWEDRAAEFASNPAATTNDIHLRELEIKTILETLIELGVSQGCLLDAGCGDGYTTLHLAEAMPNLNLLGIDYTENMLKSAERSLANRPELQGRIRFRKGNVLALNEVCGGECFDAVLSVRCLINLESKEDQARALKSVAGTVKPGGFYIAIENFAEGQENMNKARAAVGLPEIPVRWHNLYFHEDEFRAAGEPFFEITKIKDFSSSYYFATRVVYSAMCMRRGEEPDYDHDIHRLAVDLPWMGQFSPIRMAILRRKEGD